MWKLEWAEVIVLFFCSGLGFLWTLIGLCAYAVNLAAPTLDPLGILRAAVFALAYAAFVLTMFLYERGLALGSTAGALFVFLLCGAVIGLVMGTALVLANRRWPAW